MNKTHLIKLILVLMFLPVLSCAPKKPALERSHFILKTARDHALIEPAIPASLTVRDFSTSPAFQRKEIIYKTGKNTIQADFYNHYFVLPGLMISQLARSWIKESGLFLSVVPASSHMEADYILEGAINSIYGDIQNILQPEGVLEISFLLLNKTDFEYEIVFQKKYQERTRMQGRKADYLIEALNTSLEQVLSALEKDIARALSDRG